MDLALNNLQRLICHKTQTTKQLTKENDGEGVGGGERFNFELTISFYEIILLLLLFFTLLRKNQLTVKYYS